MSISIRDYIRQKAEVKAARAAIEDEVNQAKATQPLPSADLAAQLQTAKEIHAIYAKKVPHLIEQEQATQDLAVNNWVNLSTSHNKNVEADEALVGIRVNALTHLFAAARAANQALRNYQRMLDNMWNPRHWKLEQNLSLAEDCRYRRQFIAEQQGWLEQHYYPTQADLIASWKERYSVSAEEERMAQESYGELYSQSRGTERKE